MPYPVQKIKKDLIHNAKVKKAYSKLKSREQLDAAKPLSYAQDAEREQPPPLPATTEIHPQRQAMLDAPEPPKPTLPDPSSDRPPRQKRPSRPKPSPFAKEVKLAQQQREELETRIKRIQESRRQRQDKIEERERFRRAMAKARSGGKNGQRKLGRESKVLLEKVKRMVDG